MSDRSALARGETGRQRRVGGVDALTGAYPELGQGAYGGGGLGGRRLSARHELRSFVGRGNELGNAWFGKGRSFTETDGQTGSGRYMDTFISGCSTYPSCCGVIKHAFGGEFMTPLIHLHY